jgi:uncharacterized damage-inducible protein DinB
MNQTSDIELMLLRELEGFEREVSFYPDDQSLWETLPGVTNSAGNLAMHVAGNLQHYIGRVLGDTGYVRNRDAEFARRSGTRAEVVAELRKAANVIRDVLPKLTEAKLAGEFPESVMGMKFRTSTLLTHLCAHAGFHLGQAGYLRRVLTGNTASSGPLPLRPLAL